MDVITHPYHTLKDGLINLWEMNECHVFYQQFQGKGYTF